MGIGAVVDGLILDIGDSAAIRSGAHSEGGFPVVHPPYPARILGIAANGLGVPFVAEKTSLAWPNAKERTAVQLISCCAWH